VALSPSADAQVLKVSELTRRIRRQLESEFPAVWVRGEITGLKRPNSGHLYFQLKEGRDAAIDCVVWRTSAQRLPFEPRDGDEVEAFGGVTVYEPHGRYQLVASELRIAGLGALLRLLEERKLKLNDEGLFDADHKRPLPRFPMRVGIVTSPVGAAVRDLVAVLRARWPGLRLALAPVRVQGPGAAEEIAGAIRRFNRLHAADVLIVGRGGGSLEDLWAFNEELVVRAIFNSRIPIVTAIGHEVDHTLSDLAADVRAATPSHAAELVVRDARDVRRHVDQLVMKARRHAEREVADGRRRLAALTGKYGFRRQQDALAPQRQRIDDLIERMHDAVGSRV
jgi:exodeoxyribonuclease VII large subunit